MNSLKRVYVNVGANRGGVVTYFGGQRMLAMVLRAAGECSLAPLPKNRLLGLN